MNEAHETANEPLPDSALREQLRTLQRQHDQALARLQSLEHQNEKLIQEILMLRRQRYGRKTETFDDRRCRDIFEGDLDADLAECSLRLQHSMPAPRSPGTAPRKAGRRGAQSLPGHLPREEIRHDPESCACGTCGTALVEIGCDVSEKLGYHPGRFYVERHLRPKMACRRCETLTVAPVPAAVIDGGLATPGLLAWVVVSKYVDHLPLYRIEQIVAREGVGLGRKLLAEWIAAVGLTLEPLWQRLVFFLKQSAVLHADETPMRQLSPGAGKTHRAYLWVYTNHRLGGDPPIVVFDYQGGRSGCHPQAFLDGWQGTLMVDDYSGYKALFRQGAVRELACLAHARRRFHDLWASGQHPVARQALARIGALYAIEARAKAVAEGLAAVPDLPREEAQRIALMVRTELRQTLARPRLEALHAWMLAQRVRTAPGSPLARALDYSLRRWPALARYAENALYPIDNNPAENAIRPIALGRKNWLFVGSERAGHRAAILQSLLATARANGLDPLRWLTRTLTELPTVHHRRIDEFLPLQR